MRLLNRLHPLPSPFSGSGWGDSPQSDVSGGANRSTPSTSSGANRSTPGSVFPDSCAPFPIGAFWSIGTGCAYVLGHEPSREVGCLWGDLARAAAPYLYARFYVRFPTRFRSHQRRFSHEEVFEFVRSSAPSRLGRQSGRDRCWFVRVSESCNRSGVRRVRQSPHQFSDYRRPNQHRKPRTGTRVCSHYERFPRHGRVRARPPERNNGSPELRALQPGRVRAIQHRIAGRFNGRIQHLGCDQRLYLPRSHTPWLGTRLWKQLCSSALVGSCYLE